MHVGLFFGSFNPVHVGHMVLANYMLSFTDMDEVWFVLSPHNPLKQKAGLLDQNSRLHLLRLALEDQNRIKVNTIEFDLPQPSYTINTLVRLGEKYPSHKFSLIIGQDNLKTFSRWKNYEEILRGYDLYVYPRNGAEPSEFDSHPRVHLTAAPIIDISSTFIRQAVKDKKDMRFFLPEKVWEEIDVMNYYRK